MSATTNLNIPLLGNNTLVMKEAINAALKAIDNNATPIAHVKSGVHWAAWTANTVYSPGDIIRTDDCYSWGYLKCTSTITGASGATMPKCPYGEGDTVTDGAVTWMLKKIGSTNIQHGDLLGRDKPEQHPIAAITGLQDLLNTLITSTDAKAYTDQKISDLIGGAPSTLDTLKEIADALSKDESSVSTIIAQLANKVDKVDGKGLSTNDFTNEEKAKLDQLTVTKTADIDALAAVAHTHSNKALLDTYNQSNSDIKDAVGKKHAHSNKDVLDKFSDSGGILEYNGAPLMTKKDVIKFALIF